MNDYVQLDESFISISDAIVKLSVEKGLPAMAGGSGRGWSRFALLQRCPRAFLLRHHRQVKEEGSDLAREVGSAFHGFLAFHYMAKKGLTARWLFNGLLECQVNPQALAEGWRLFDAYQNHWVADYLIPLAVEYRAQDPRTRFNCRYDLIAKIENPPEHTGLSAGIYIIEHKSTGKFDMASLDSWDLDGEILGEIAFYKRCGLDKEFGPLQGLCVNIVGKQRTPQFHRTWVAPNTIQTQQHIADLQYWALLESQFTKTGRWPRALAGCIGRYGACGYFNYCRNEVG